jgi:glycyl-tRNA synthetase beta chain
MSNLLIEITTEDMPAQGQLDQGLKFLEIIAENLELKATDFSIAMSPRHFCIFTKNISLQKKISIKGPKVSAEAPAITGFLNRYKVAKSALIERDNCYFYEKLLDEKEGQIIMTRQIEKSFNDMVWHKSMIWGCEKTRWIRPIKSLMVFFDQELLPVTFGTIKTSNYTNVNKEKLYLSSADYNLYLNKLKEKNIIVSHEERKRIILEGIDALLRPLQLQTIENQSLLEELVSLVENPQIYLGKIDKEFLQLPRELLLTSLAKNQKYLLTEDLQGNIAPFFIIVANIKAEDAGKNLIAGHEKVLKARLKDATFFITEDQKDYPKVKATSLDRIIFHEKLGTISEKVVRLEKFVQKICQELKVNLAWLENAASLCKNDLTTNLVREFPELQGFTGYYYSKLQGFDEELALAIRDHYKPMGVKDSLPETLGGAILAMADKLDHLISFFGVGIKPTATKDPYALRRAALGLLRIKNHFNLDLNFAKFVQEDLLNFLAERAKQAKLPL